MPAQTQVYLYNQRQYVVLLEITANAARRYEKVYAKELVINRGVDNLIEFAFINQEQKPVNIQGKTITCRIINYNGGEIILQKTLTPLLPITGITTLQLSAAEIEDIDVQQCFYSLEIPVGSFNYPVFVDDNGGARGVIRIVNSVLPRFIAANNVTIPTHPRPLSGVPRTYYSSIVQTYERSVLSTQWWLEQFTGTLQFQGSTIGDFSTFYTIGPEWNYADYTSTAGYTIDGFHPFIRLKVVNNGTPPAGPGGDLLGDIVKLLSR
jgi:hypothetical protein